MSSIDGFDVDEKDLEIGERRAAIIRPLAAQRKCSRAAAEEAAKTLNVSVRYVYRLLRKWRTSGGLLISLIPQKSTGGRGESRLSQLQEGLIFEVVDELHYSSQSVSPNRVIEEVQKRCIEMNVETPSNMTIRRRLHMVLNMQDYR